MSEVLFGPYRLGAVLGAGGMGEVRRAYDTRRDREVALKRLHPSLASDGEFRARFQQESAVAARLHEPHVIPIHDYGEIDGQLFIDMRLVEGVDLADVLTSGPMPVRRAVDVLSQVADALDAAHRGGLVHRDVKPSNVLLVPRGTEPGRDFVYLVDFGIAGVLGATRLTRTGTAVGTTAYMAPERFTGPQHAWDHRVDVYALACVLYECLAGRAPFVSENVAGALYAHVNTPPPHVTATRTDLPRELDEVVRRGMAKEPGDRYDSPGAMMSAARTALDRRPPTGEPPTALRGPVGPGTVVPRSGPQTAWSPGPPTRESRPPTPARPGDGSGPPRRGTHHPEPAHAAHPGAPHTGHPGGATAGGPGLRGSAASGPHPRDAETRGALPDGGPGPSRPGTSGSAAPDEPGGGRRGPTAPFPDERPRSSRRRFLQVLGGSVALLAVGGGTVYGLNAAGVIGGRRPWAFATGDKVYSSPAVADGTLVVGSNDGALYGLEAATGSERWKLDTGASVTSSPVIADGVVYVGGNDRKVHAVDLASGALLWESPLGEVIHSSPTVDAGTVYVGCRDNGLYALDAATGQQRWRFEGGDWFNSSPAVADGTVYVGCRDFDVYAIDAAAGERVWAHTTGSTVDSSPTVADGKVVIGGDDGRVRALTAAGGELIWEFAAQAGVVSTPLVDAGVVYVGSDDALLYALEADTGRRRWSFPTGGGIRSSPALADGTVFVGSGDQNLYAVGAQSGDLVWRADTGGPIDDSSPVVVNGWVYVGSLSGSVLCIKADEGALPS